MVIWFGKISCIKKALLITGLLIIHLILVCKDADRISESKLTMVVIFWTGLKNIQWLLHHVRDTDRKLKNTATLSGLLLATRLRALNLVPCTLSLEPDSGRIPRKASGNSTRSFTFHLSLTFPRPCRDKSSPAGQRRSLSWNAWIPIGRGSRCFPPYHWFLIYGFRQTAADLQRLRLACR